MFYTALVDVSVEVRVAWNQAEYSVEEGSNVRVCAVQLQLSDLAFTVDVNSPPSDGIFFSFKEVFCLVKHFTSRYHFAR